MNVAVTVVQGISLKSVVSISNLVLWNNCGKKEN